MKVLAIGGFAIAAGAALYFFAGTPRPANIYDMSVDEAYARLAVRQFDESYVDNKPIGGDVDGNGSNQIKWSNGSHNYCDIALAPDPNFGGNVHVDVTCNGGGTGLTGIAGITHNLMRNEVIERVDSLLDGRAYDKRRSLGETAARWPTDGATGGYGAAVGEAMKMDADMRKMQHEAGKAMEKYENKARFGSEGRSYSAPGYQ